MSKVLNQFIRRRFPQSRSRASLRLFGKDSPDSAPPSSFQIETFLDVVGERQRCFDDFPVEIYHVKCAVRPDCQVDWTKPGIGGGEEFAVGFCSLGNEGGAVSNQDIPMHQIVGGITDEDIVMKWLRKKVGRINLRTARGGDVSSRYELGGGKPLRLGTDAKDLASGAMVRDVDGNGRRGQCGIPAKIVIR